MSKRKKFESPELSTKELSAELVITNLKLQEAHEKLLHSEQARSEIFANISHDLRSPLTAIKNATELLQQMNDLDAEKAKPLLLLMNQRIETMEKMINDIFLLVTLDNKCIQMDFESIPFTYFLEDFFFSCEADNTYKNRKLVLEIPENLPGTILADSKQLKRVLDNLFTNALKYSHDGDIIKLGAYIKDDNYVVYIEDTGIGIAKEDLEKIFFRSYIVKKARTPNISSTGFGLSITKSILSYFNGTIWCESTLGTGTRFSFQIPLEKTKES